MTRHPPAARRMTPTIAHDLHAVRPGRPGTPWRYRCPACFVEVTEPSYRRIAAWAVAEAYAEGPDDAVAYIVGYVHGRRSRRNRPLVFGR